MEQRSDEWFAIRRGKVTASRIADIIAPHIKSGYKASRAKYMRELLKERRGEEVVRYTSRAMDWGTNVEKDARHAYEVSTGNLVWEVGFVPHFIIENAGASPDGLVSPDGLIEIKCPNTSTHLATISANASPAKYEFQMQWQMACTGARWCDFVSYDLRVDEQDMLFIKRVERDNRKIAFLEQEVVLFLSELIKLQKSGKE